MSWEDEQALVPYLDTEAGPAIRNLVAETRLAEMRELARQFSREAGGKATAKRFAENRDALTDLLDEAHRQLRAEGYRRIGRSRLANRASQIDPECDLSERAIRTYLKTRP